LKKNKIAVDLVSFGEGCAEENRPKLESLHGAVNNHDNSFIVTLPPGEHMLSQMIASTPIVRGADAGPAPAGGAGAAGGGGTYEEYGGIDPNVDPELAEAMRLSLESAATEKKQRDPPAAAPAAPTATAPAAAPAAGDAMDVDDMDDELRAAIALSLSSNQPEAKPASTSAPANPDAMDVEEDDELAAALKLSKQTASPDASKDEKGDSGAVDSNYMASVLLNLPGMDPNDPEVQEILKNMKAEQEKNEKDKK